MLWYFLYWSITAERNVVVSQRCGLILCPDFLLTKPKASFVDKRSGYEMTYYKRLKRQYPITIPTPQNKSEPTMVSSTPRYTRNVRYPQTLDDPYSPCCRQRCLHFRRRRRRRRRRQSANTAASDSKSSHSINSS